MKKLLILILVIATGYSAPAQQKTKTNYMTISIYGQIGHINNMIVTRTDSAQDVQTLKIKLHTSSVMKYQAELDTTLLKLVRPYYDKGWKLIGFAVDNSIFLGGDYSSRFIYQLSKDQ